MRLEEEGIEDLFRRLFPLLKEKMCNEFQDQDEEKHPIIFRVPDEIDLNWARKVLEAGLADVDLNIQLSVNRHASQESGTLKSKTVAAHKLPPPKVGADKRATLTVTTICEGTRPTFSDVLKQVRESTNPEQHGVVVQRIRETADGQLRLHIREIKKGGNSAFAAALE